MRAIRPLLTVSSRLMFGYERASQSMRIMRGRLHDPDLEAFSLLPDEGLFLDIGANIGQTLASIRALRPRWRVHCVEPNPIAVEHVRQVAARLGGAVDITAAAVSTEPEAVLHVPRVGRSTAHQAASLDPGFVERRGPELRRTFRRQPVLEPVAVPTIRIDELAVDPIGVKIDVEGFERNVVSTMVETLRRSGPLVMYETRHAVDRLDDLWDQVGYEGAAWDRARGCFVTGLPEGDAVNAFAFPQGRFHVDGR